MPIERASGRVLAEPAARRRRPAAVPELGHGRLRAALVRTPPSAPRDAAGGGPDPGRRPCGAAAGAGRGDGHRHRRRGAGGRRRRRPASSSSRRRTATSRWARRSRPARTSAIAAATSGPARPCSSPASCWPPGRSARWRPPASPRCGARSAHASASSSRARSSVSPVRSWGPARSTSPTACCSPRRSSWPERCRPSSGSSLDIEEEHRRTIERALLGFDMLVTTGGASVGPHDLVRKVQAGLGVEEVFWGVAVKPGKPDRLRRQARPPRLQPPREPGVGARHLRAARPAGGQRAARAAPAAAGLPARGAGCWPSAATPIATSSSGRRWPRRNGEPVVTPVSGQESHMIVRAGRAVRPRLDPGRRGRDRGRRGRPLSCPL